MSSTPYIKTVLSNVKKGVSCEISRRTLLVGPNGSGKTSVQNAIELATNGFASDVEGRVRVKVNYALGRLGPGSEALVAEVEFSDGTKSSWKLRPNKKGGYHDPDVDVPQNPRVIFPVADVREVLSGSPETVRTWLMGRVAADLREEDIVIRLPDALHAEYRTAAKRLRQPGWTEIDVLLTVTEAAKKEARAADAEAKKSKQVIEMMSEGMEFEPTAGDVASAEQDAVDAEKAYQEASRQPRQSAPDVERYRREATEAVQAFQKASETAGLAQSAMPPMHPSEEALIEFRAKMADVAEVTANLKSSTCLVCDSPLGVVDIAYKAQILRQQNATGAAAVQAAKIYREKEAEAARLQATAMKLVELFQQVERQAHAAPLAPQVDVQALGDEVVRTRSHLNDLRMQKRAWANLRTAKDDVRNLGEKSARHEELVSAAAEVVDELLKSAHKKFEKAVQAFLPPEDKFAMVLVENKKPVCRMGFKRGSTLHTALSGAEWARLTLALGCATYKDSPDLLAVFIPEERAFDGDTLADVMSALNKAPGQVLLQSPNMPSLADGKTDGWQIISLV
jgi:energy-coupling factor transporter ATP-binding protein EcfA2